MENIIQMPVSQESMDLSTGLKMRVKELLKSHRNTEMKEIYTAYLDEVEKPLLVTVMRYTHNNQSEAARILGLSRGTLRKKLKHHFDSCYVSIRDND